MSENRLPPARQSRERRWQCPRCGTSFTLEMVAVVPACAKQEEKAFDDLFDWHVAKHWTEEHPANA